MAKAPQAKQSERQDAARAMTGRIPKADRDGQNTDYNPFLKAEHIARGKLGARAVLVLTGRARVVDGTYGEQIIAEVRHDGKLYDWGITLNRPNHRLLEDRAGVETDKWRGKKIPVTLRENLGKVYIAIDRT
jgi:hypothetical protein